jgi:hypothetical protein
VNFGKKYAPWNVSTDDKITESVYGFLFPGQSQAQQKPVTYKKPAKVDLIPKPKGMGGRSHNGYNIQIAMGLSNNKAKYNMIEVSEQRANISNTNFYYIAYLSRCCDAVPRHINNLEGTKSTSCATCYYNGQSSDAFMAVYTLLISPNSGATKGSLLRKICGRMAYP